MSKKTALYEQHIAAGGKMVDFAGWEMPIHYGSQLNEHHYIRQEVGVFDVSHMTIVDVKGADSKTYLRYVLANDVAKLKEPGKALYTCMLNEQAGIIDDLIVYFIAKDCYRLVVNAATREKDLAWLNKQAQAFQISLQVRTDLAILAIQGPQACQKVDSLLAQEFLAKLDGLKNFQFLMTKDWLVARTGYTGEDGYEIMLPNEQVAKFWQAILAAGIKPCGLGARDTLRLEAGLNLYGSDMDESTTPLESNLAWTVAMQPEERDFIGRSSLIKQQQRGIEHKLVGVVLAERGVLRSHQRVVLADGSSGETTSGTFSPTLNKGIALARVPASIKDTCQIDMRGKLVTAHVVKPLFVKQGLPTQQINLILNLNTVRENL
jgi:aminomethyltransferase